MKLRIAQRPENELQVPNSLHLRRRKQVEEIVSTVRNSVGQMRINAKIHYQNVTGVSFREFEE